MPEKLSLITDPFATPAAGGLRPFEATPRPAPRDSLIAESGEADRLQDAARRAPALPPERAARLLRVQRRTGFPVDLVDRNLDELEQQSAAGDFDVERFRATSPLLSRWLAENPAHLALAQDDLRPLSVIERTLRIGRNVVGAAGEGVMSFAEGAWGGLEAGLEVSAAVAGRDTGLASVARDHVASFARDSAAVARHLAARSRGPQTGAGFVESSIYSGIASVGQMAPSLVAGVVAGPAALLSVVGATTSGQGYSQARAQGVGIPKAAAFGGLQGAIEVGTEFLPARFLLGDLAAKTPILLALAHQIASEIPGEQIATALQDLTAWALLPENAERTFVEYLDARPSAAAATAISTITAVGLQTAVMHGTVRVLDTLGTAARDSKTIGRAPEALRALVDQVVADGPLASVGLPVEEFTTYFQSKQIDPVAMATQLTGDPRAYAHAQATGEDLAVPMSRYLTEMAATEHHDYFRHEARLAPDALNAREARALEQDVAAELAIAGTVPAAASVGQVRDRVLTLLDQAAIPAETARVYAEVLEQGFQSIGTRAGLDPVALFDRYGLRVERAGAPVDPVPAAAPVVALAPDVAPTSDVFPTVARAADSPTQRAHRRRAHWAELLASVLRDAQTVDPTVDPAMIRAEFAARRDQFEEGRALTRESGRNPETLLRAIARYGGLWHERTGTSRGEIAVLRESNTSPDRVGGVKGVFRKAGLDPDAMLEALRQDPEFQWIETINDLLDAVDTAVRQPEADTTLPGSDELAGALQIQLGTAWWIDARRAAAAPADDETAFFQPAVHARRAQLEEQIRLARAKGRDDLLAQLELQKLLDADADQPAPAPAVLDRHDFDFFRSEDRGAVRGELRFGKDRQFTISLFAGADLSTFLHETAHVYFEVLGDVVDELSALDPATFTPTQRQLLADYGALLAEFGVDNRQAITTEHHERFARLFEAYLMEGSAPSLELRSVFARARAWLVGIYRAVQKLNVTVSPEIRAVLDRMLATDDAIAAAQAEQRVRPLFTDAIADAAGLSPADRDAYGATVQAASDRAHETVQRMLLQQLARERTAWWGEERSTIRAGVARDVAAQPVYRALALLQRGTLPDGAPLPAGVDAFKLSHEALLAQFGADVVARLPRPLVYTPRTGLPASLAAELLGFPSGSALVDALIQAPPIADAIDAATDAEMRRRHGDALFDGSLADHARLAVLEAGAEVFAAELTALTAAATRQQPGARRVTAPPVSTLRAIAERRIAGTPLREIRPEAFAAAARRAGTQALAAAGRQDFAAALLAKQKQVLNAELYRAAAAARALVDAAVDGFRPIVFGRDAALAQRHNLDLVNAARALLAQFGLAPPAQTVAAHVSLEQVRRYDPEMYADLELAIDAAAQPGKPYKELTLDEFIALRDAVGNLWHLARRSRQMVIDGKARDVADVRADLEARLLQISAPRRRRGYDRAVTRWEKTKLELLGFRAALRRVESWADAVDGANPRGVFRQFLFTPISEAAARYRIAKRTILERYLAIVKVVEPSLTPHDIAAPEIGYTFAGKMELLHALLHTGNASNVSKLLRGRNWGTEDPDGNLDASRWEAFVRRAWQQGILTATDYTYVQATWDLLEEIKPDAQRVHHDLFGYYFAEITAQPIETPFGTFRGGYVPAMVDVFIATDASMRADKEALEQTPTSFMFPTTGRGFTKGRIEPYARPLALDLRIVPAHLDKVLRFIHLEPRVKDAARLLTNKGFRRALDAFDPTVGGELLVPWLQRTARQSVERPGQGWGGRGADRFWRAVRRRTGLQVMVGNVVNALQQVTGVPVAALKVPPPALLRATWTYVRGPARLARTIAEKSLFMRTRTTTQTIEVQQHIDDLLLHPSTYEEARAFAQKHGYFFQAATQNMVDLITWSGAYDHAIAEGATEAEAITQADTAVRLTQGSFSPEDLSAFETGTPFMRAFTMFYSYFNMLANTLGSEFAVAIRDLGLRAGAGRMLYVYVFGLMIPSVMSELLIQAMSGQPWDEDEDGLVVDDLLALFFGAQRRTLTAMIPGAGPVINAGINAFNDKWYDDRISVSPGISAIERAAHAPHTVYEALVNDGRKKTAIRDALTAIGLLTGLPVAPLGKPLGYLADVVDEDVEPSSALDAARGAVVGR